MKNLHYTLLPCFFLLLALSLKSQTVTQVCPNEVVSNYTWPIVAPSFGTCNFLKEIKVTFEGDPHGANQSWPNGTPFEDIEYVKIRDEIFVPFQPPIPAVWEWQYTGIIANLNDKSFTFDLNWKEGWTGEVTMKVYHKYYSSFGCPSFWFESGSFTFVKQMPDENGSLITQEVVPLDQEGQPQELAVQWQSGVNNGYLINQFRYKVENDGIESEYVTVTPNQEMTFLAMEFGEYTYSVDAFFSTSQGQACGWSPLASKTIDVVPSCYNDNANSFNATVTGNPGIINHGGLKYQVEPNTEYEVNASGVKDFDNHYEWVHNGADALQLSDNIFQITPLIGSYRLTAERKPGRESCPYLSNLPLKLFTGGSDQTFFDPCIIVLPEWLETQGFDPNDVELQFFNMSIASSKAVIVEPGVSLTLGADLTIEPREDILAEADANLNWVESSSYDETGKLMANQREYFDSEGNTLQSQWANLSERIVLANQTIYDQLDRKSLQTLAAPILSSGITTIADPACPNDPDIVIDSDIYFHFKEDFITNTSGEEYSYTDFENSGTQQLSLLKQTEPGSLGWYYSNNNISGAHPTLAEPLVASTNSPFVQVIYDENDGTVLSSIQAGDAYRSATGNQHLATSEIIPVDASWDAILNTYLTHWIEVFPSSTLDLPKLKSLVYVEYKQDADGIETRNLYNKADELLIKQSVSMTTPLLEFNFFDAKGRLIHSVTPNGIVAFKGGEDWVNLDKITYQYDNKNRVTDQTTVDDGKTAFMYRADGQVKFSQDALQESRDQFAYVNYDREGRPIESGVFTTGTSPFLFGSSLIPLLELRGVGDGLPMNKTEQTFSFYDLQDNADNRRPFDQHFVHGKLSFSEKAGVMKTWYSYDEQGRIVKTANYYHGLNQTKIVEYAYDANGQVSQVDLQKDQTDAFIHKYSYDADARLLRTETASAANPIFTVESDYQYYLQGGVKGMDLADQLQQIDYTYTSEGWLKAINGDGLQGAGTPADVFRMTLEYHNQDYQKNGVTIQSTDMTGYAEHYNGLVRGTTWYTQKPQGYVMQADGSFRDEVAGIAYQYNNRLQLMQADYGIISGSSFTKSQNMMKVSSYDHNGNMRSMKRYTETTVEGLRDDFSAYNYIANTNRHTSINNYMTYSYDVIGQVTAQNSLSTDYGSEYYDYDNRGHITAVYDDAAKQSLISTMQYDAAGYMVSESTTTSQGALVTRYLRDFTGVLLATYTNADPVTGVPLTTYRQEEVSIYSGGQRIGLYLVNENNKIYELTDHLGNVRAVIEAEVVGNVRSVKILNITDYYPYGSRFRHYQSEAYRFSYQGQFAEELAENRLHFFARTYDPLTGRFNQVDPVRHNSPYAGMGNNPVSYVDPRGEEIVLATAMIVGAIVGAYTGGVIANDGQLNPLAWDWESGKTWKGILIGAAVGAATGYVAHQAFWAASPWLGVKGAAVTPLGDLYLAASSATKGFKRDIDIGWSTIAGGGGSASLSQTTNSNQNSIIIYQINDDGSYIKAREREKKGILTVAFSQGGERIIFKPRDDESNFESVSEFYKLGTGTNMVNGEYFRIKPNGYIIVSPNVNSSNAVFHTISNNTSDYKYYYLNINPINITLSKPDFINNFIEWRKRETTSGDKSKTRHDITTGTTRSLFNFW